ncbi:BsuPI-related putative proteinase inhibitor [Halobacillus faecis]|uniref:Intracellular proteinase inhibitor BsuPI domain-containing protein n=1 Tax=Halobacillus faecis TaxID=360184 RepID=A0A511WTP2_9BACI|nr:BsuPI-related putative proteinase inhibitor [Halobacillus faecis]GEN54516.1 hypothetical protein HFA01_27780 [Halobacillus faecis]
MAKFWSVLSLILLLGGAVWWVNASYNNPQQRTSSETSGSETPASNDHKKEVHATLEWKGAKMQSNHFEYAIHNDTDGPITLPFRSGQRYEYYVRDGKGQLIDTYSKGKMFTQEVTEKVIEPGETYTEKIMLSPLPPGSYVIEVESVSEYKNKFKKIAKFEVKDQE